MSEVYASPTAARENKLLVHAPPLGPNISKLLRRLHAKPFLSWSGLVFYIRHDTKRLVCLALFLLAKK
jgi:hypothetical protein